MILRRAHDLRFPLQIAYARSGTIATNLEQALVVFPCEIVKDDDVIGVRRVVVFAKRGIPRHDPKYIPRRHHKHSIGGSIRVCPKTGAEIALRRSSFSISFRSSCTFSIRRRMASRRVAGGRAKRETTGTTNAPDFPTAAAVAEGIYAAWYLIRDA